MLYKRIINRLYRGIAEKVQGRDPRDIARIHPQSLLFSFGNVYSQVGQDGIIHEILHRIDGGLPTERSFVEFGAWDGMYLSNCRWLVEQGWQGLYIEGDAKRFSTLQANYRNLAHRIRCANAYVGAPNRGLPGKTVGELVNESGLDPDSVCVMVIDVDGLDLEIFQNLGLRPAVILMEGGHSFSPRVTKQIPVGDAAKNIHQPISHIVDVTKACGYEPVCFHQDMYLVRADLADPFRDCPKSPLQLYADSYHFLTIDQRKHIHSYRSGSDIVRDHETLVLGGFDENPLAGC